MTPKNLMADIMARLETEHKALSRDLDYPVVSVITSQRRIIKIDGKEFLIEVSEIK